mmetsp:Transcript_56859/g.182722  ORF Transcript_56859/g.182722 Transcript_56859/m.182722 type:complete len:231 (+) Transcript_56859:160-852(+)
MRGAEPRPVKVIRFDERARLPVVRHVELQYGPDHRELVLLLVLLDHMLGQGRRPLLQVCVEDGVVGRHVVHRLGHDALLCRILTRGHVAHHLDPLVLRLPHERVHEAVEAVPLAGAGAPEVLLGGVARVDHPRQRLRVELQPDGVPVDVRAALDVDHVGRQPRRLVGSHVVDLHEDLPGRAVDRGALPQLDLVIALPVPLLQLVEQLAVKPHLHRKVLERPIKGDLDVLH